jgi:hypothetical protein
MLNSMVSMKQPTEPPVHDPPVLLDLTSPSHPLHAIVRACEASAAEFSVAWPNVVAHEILIPFRSIQVLPSAYEDDVDAPPAGYRERDVISFCLSELRDACDPSKFSQLRVWMQGQVDAGNDVVATGAVRSPSGVTKFLPMIDFLCDSTEFVEIDRATERKLKLGIEAFSFYDSGRSFHAYGPALMTEAEYLNFLGACLLLGDGLVDSRWVGHCLMRGFPSLRLTCTSSYYLKAPKLEKTSPLTFIEKDE